MTNIYKYNIPVKTLKDPWSLEKRSLLADILFLVCICLHLHRCQHSSNLWTFKWILTKLALILMWDRWKKWLDFGDLDLIFKITRVIYACLLSISEPMAWFWPNWHRYIIWRTLKMIRSWWPWPNFQGHQGHITMKKPCLQSFLLNQWPDFDQTGTGTSLGGP